MKNFEVGKYFKKYVWQNKLVVVLMVGLVLWLVYYLRYFVAMIFVAYILSATLLPLKKKLIDKGTSNFLASFISVFLLIAILVLFLVPILVVAVQQFQALITEFPELLNRAQEFLPFRVIPEDVVGNIVDRFLGAGGNILELTRNIFGSFISLFLVIFTSFYFLYDREMILESVNRIFESKKRTNKFNQIERKLVDGLGKWVRGQAILSLVVGVLFWVAYIIIGLPFSLSLAFLAAILEIIPTLGPTLAIIPALIVALTISPIIFLYVLIAFTVIQLSENYLLAPNILKRVVGLHPLVIVFSVILGTELLGIIGALLAVPLVFSIKIIINEIRNN